jgi:hypothetical protein
MLLLCWQYLANSSAMQKQQLRQKLIRAQFVVPYLLVS